MTRKINRCSWCEGSELAMRYHDEEWGVPAHDDRTLFEFLVLEGAQAGLSWNTILNKRESYRRLFNNFEVDRVARWDRRKIESLLRNPAIVRNRLKVESARSNARAFIRVQKEFGSFDRYIWQFTGGKVVVNRWKRWQDIPSTSDISDRMSKDLKKRGFRFAGSTICYAFMQAVGMVNDHTTDCFRYRLLVRGT